MSHWTKIELKFNDPDVLVAALQKMGATNVQTGSKQITQYGKTDTASIWLDNGVGFKQNEDGNFSMIGDFYHSKDFRKYYNNLDKFNQDLNVAYGVEDATMKLEGLGIGFTLTDNEELNVGEDGMIRLQFTTYQEIG